MVLYLHDSIKRYDTYTITRSSEEITWAIDGKLVRTVKHSKTKNKEGVFEYPTHAA
jgi:beta-glucanase (GH16 family)